MSPQDRTEGWKFTFLFPLCAPLRFSQTAFSFAPDKRPENIPDLEEVISAAEATHTYRGRIQACKSKGLSYLHRDHHDGRRPLRLMEHSPTLGPSSLIVHLLRLLEDSLEITSD